MRSRAPSKDSTFKFAVWKPLAGIVYFVGLAAFKYAIPYVCQRYAILSKDFEQICLLVNILASVHGLILITYTGSIFALKKRALCGILLLILTSVGTVAGLVCLRRMVEFDLVSEETTLAIVRDYVQEHEKIPLWLEHTQLTQRCCGINSFKDYRALMYHGKEEKFKEDVPVSCCHSYAQAHIGICRSKGPNWSSDLTEGITGIFVKKPDLPRVLNYDSIENMSKRWSQHKADKHTGLAPLFHILQVNEAKAGNYHQQGCYDYLLERTIVLYRLFVCFLLVTTAVSFYLGFSYLTRGEKYTTRCRKSHTAKSQRA